MTHDITRTEAAAVINQLRDLVVQTRGQHPENFRALAERILRGGYEDGQPAYDGRKSASQEIPELRACTGEAHSNAFIDNCARCAPRWGIVGPAVRVR